MKSAQENLLQQQDSEVDNIHVFSLKPLDQKAYKSKAVTFTFTPINSESKQIPIMPRLNHSDDCFQPLFQNPYIKNLLQINGEIPQTFLSGKSGPSRTPLSYRSSQDKVEGSKPRPTSKYCQVCKQKFNDYLDHIKHKVHITNLKANPFQKYIELLIQDFKAKTKRDRPITISSREQLPFAKPKKKIKNSSQIVSFSMRNVNSTESTTASSAIVDSTEKKQILDSLKE